MQTAGMRNHFDTRRWVFIVKTLISGLVFILFILLLPGCAPKDKEEEPAHEDVSAEATMGVSSESLISGRWSDTISNLPGGENLSPQISFSPVPDAESYCIYMLDESAGQWEHWISYHLTETEYAEGEKTDTDTYSYIGPYPPKGSGEHTYTVYVFALKADPDGGYPSAFDAPFITADELREKHLDISGGKPGNVLGYGTVSGTFSND